MKTTTKRILVGIAVFVLVEALTFQVWLIGGIPSRDDSKGIWVGGHFCALFLGAMAACILSKENLEP